MIYWDNNDYFYYGQAVDLKFRWRAHSHNFKYKKHGNRKLQRIFNKYGSPNYSIVEICEEDELDRMEQSYIDLWFGNYYCCNLSPTATSNKGVKWTEESKRKRSNALIGEKSTWWRKKHKDETKNKMSKSRREYFKSHPGIYNGINNPFFGKHHSELSKEKIRKRLSSDANKWKGGKHKEESKKLIGVGNKKSWLDVAIRKKRMEGKRKLWNDPVFRKKMKECGFAGSHMGGKKHTEESISKMRECRMGEKNSFYGKKHSIKMRERMSNLMRGRVGVNSKLVLNILTGIYYPCTRDAYNSYPVKMSLGYFQSSIKGNRKIKVPFIYA